MQPQYVLPELLLPNHTVMLRDGRVGTVKRFLYNDDELPHGLPQCNHEGLREIVVETDAGEVCTYAYKLTRIEERNDRDILPF